MEYIEQKEIAEITTETTTKEMAVEREEAEVVEDVAVDKPQPKPKKDDKETIAELKEKNKQTRARRDEATLVAKNLRAEIRELKKQRSEADKSIKDLITQVNELNLPKVENRLVFDKAEFKKLAINRVAINKVTSNGRARKSDIPGVNKISSVFKDIPMRDKMIASFITSIGVGTSYTVVHVDGVSANLVNTLANIELDDIVSKVQSHLKVNSRLMNDEEVSLDEKAKYSTFVKADEVILENLNKDRVIVLLSSKRNTVVLV